MNKCEKSKDGEHRWTEYTSGWACMFCMTPMPDAAPQPTTGLRQVGWLTKGGAFMPMHDRYGRPVETPEGWEPYQPIYVMDPS